MIKPTIFTWIIAIFGAITFLPLMLAQLFMLFKPNDQNFSVMAKPLKLPATGTMARLAFLFL
jgi:hypothetical protein